jgi:hypothetical protein
MLTRPGPFYVSEIARAIARLPGRAEVDHEEAYRIADDIAEWYLRGEFRDDEVVAYAGDPPALRSLGEIKEDARRRGENWCLSQPEWRAACMLTAPAARRYLEGCGLAGAQRVLREWFAEVAVPEATETKTELPSEQRHRKPGPKPTRRNAIADRMFDDLCSKRHTSASLRSYTLSAVTKEYADRSTLRKRREKTRWHDFQNFRIKF